MNWSADFQIGALEKSGLIAPIWKSALRCAFKGSKREIFRGNLSPPADRAREWLWSGHGGGGVQTHALFRAAHVNSPIRHRG
jgi:hypothetical protein